MTVCVVGSALMGGGCASSRPPRGRQDCFRITQQKTAWHGFDRYDFLIDEKSLAIKPIKAQPDEGERHQASGRKRPATMQSLVMPKVAAAMANPWSWRGVYWDHQPQTEVELLRRGFCIAYVESDQNLKPDKSWDAWYESFYAQKPHGLSPKPAFVGMSHGLLNTPIFGLHCIPTRFPAFMPTIPAAIGMS